MGRGSSAIDDREGRAVEAWGGSAIDGREGRAVEAWGGECSR